MAALYGEPTTATSEDFFGSLDAFLESFAQAKKDIERAKRREEEEARKRREAEVRVEPL